MFVAFLNLLRSNGVAPDIVRLNTGWTVTYKGKTDSVELLSHYTYPGRINAGDSLVFESLIPANVPSRAVMRIRSYHNAVVVYAEDSCLYKYDIGMAGINFVGSGYHYVYMNPVENQKLKVIFIEQVDNRLVSLSSFDLLPVEYALSDYSARHIFALIVGVFLVLFGILAVIVSAVTRLYGINYFRSMMIGILSLSLGTWTMCYTKLIQIVSFNYALNTALEYFCLYFSALPLTLLLWNMHKDNLNRAKNIGFIILVCYEVLFTLTTTVLHLEGIAFYPRTLLYYHVSVVVGFAFFIYAGVLYNKKMDISGKILTQGVVVFGLFALIDLVRYNLDRILPIESALLETTWIPLGTLFFVLLLVHSYLVYLFNILEDRAEKEVLATMAYVDALTGLYNRAKCQQIFELLARGDDDYAIVSIDLNGLKLVNDNYGHNAGDKFIKTFAKVLENAFTGIGTAIRVGGDEFLAIVRSEHIEDVNASLAKMTELQKALGADLPIPLEAAYGVAYRREIEKVEPPKDEMGVSEETSEEGVLSDVENVYRLADERMYAMKAEMKSNLVRR